EAELSACVRDIALAGQPFILVQALESLASVRADMGRARPAAVLLGAADAARAAATAGMRPAPSTPVVESVRGTLGDADFTVSFAEGKRLTPVQAIEADTERFDSTVG